jgi:hypothetical protein
VRRSKWAQSWSGNEGEMEPLHGALMSRPSTSLYTSLLLRRGRTILPVDGEMLWMRGDWREREMASLRFVSLSIDQLQPIAGCLHVRSERVSFPTSDLYCLSQMVCLAIAIAIMLYYIIIL